MFELIEAAFDAVATAIEQSVVRDQHLAIALGGNHRLHPSHGQKGSQGVAVVSLVGDQSAAFDPGKQDCGALDIGRLARSQTQA
jgi:hypothetical protein